MVQQISGATTSITAIDASGPTIEVNAGNWYGSNGSGTSGGDTVVTSTAVTNGDNLVDSPTNGDTASDTGLGGEVVGNYATLNPLVTAAAGYLTNGNLELKPSGNLPNNARSTIGVTSGKWYAEFTLGHEDCYLGIALNELPSTTWVGNSIYGWAYHPNGNIYHNSGSVAYGDSFVVGDIIGVAFDADNSCLLYTSPSPRD